MHGYAGNDNFPATVSLIDDSDPPNATNFGTGPEGLADRTVWLKNRLASDFFLKRLAYAINDDPALGVVTSWTDFPVDPDTNGFILANLSAADFAANDVVEVTFTGNISGTASSDSIAGL